MLLVPFLRPAPPLRPGLLTEAVETTELEILVRGLADGLLSGEMPSLVRGSGVEADGVRPYVHGDDVRALDWRVTARTGRAHVRELVEERGGQVHLVVDRSASLHACASSLPGRVAVHAAGAVAAAALGAGHPVGLLQVTDRAEGHIPAARDPHQLRWVLGALQRLHPRGSGTALGPARRGLGGILGARARGVIVSDFRVPPAQRDELGASLAGLARRHDVVPLRILNAGPEDLPPVGRVSVLDPETGRRTTLDTSDPVTRERLRAAAEEAEAWRATLWARLAVPPVTVDPHGPLDRQLRAGFARRAGRAA
ncbi:MAG: DUF58 domain-containing protein [Gemmatimonadetes bacterium]|nr:DUF58 domain-containing protein [Gemmatimonadota bacterium]